MGIKNGLQKEGDEYFISDRLGFYTRLEGEEVFMEDPAPEPFWAMLTIDT